MHPRGSRAPPRSTASRTASLASSRSGPSWARSRSRAASRPREDVAEGRAATTTATPESSAPASRRRPTPSPTPGHRRQRARRGRHGVARDEDVGLDDVRERCGQPGEDEAVDADDGERAAEEHRVVATARERARTTTRQPAARTQLAKTSTRCRLQRSRRTPANGPISEYGSRMTANARATRTAEVCRSGEKKTNDASAGLEAAVGDLTDDPDGEQPPEAGAPEQGDERVRDGGQGSSGPGRRASRNRGATTGAGGASGPPAGGPGSTHGPARPRPRPALGSRRRRLVASGIDRDGRLGLVQGRGRPPACSGRQDVDRGSTARRRCRSHHRTVRQVACPLTMKTTMMTAIIKPRRTSRPGHQAVRGRPSVPSGRRSRPGRSSPVTPAHAATRRARTGRPARRRRPRPAPSVAKAPRDPHR